MLIDSAASAEQVLQRRRSFARAGSQRTTIFGPNYFALESKHQGLKTRNARDAKLPHAYLQAHHSKMKHPGDESPILWLEFPPTRCPESHVPTHDSCSEAAINKQNHSMPVLAYLSRHRALIRGAVSSVLPCTSQDRTRKRVYEVDSVGRAHARLWRPKRKTICRFMWRYIPLRGKARTSRSRLIAPGLHRDRRAYESR